MGIAFADADADPAREAARTLYTLLVWDSRREGDGQGGTSELAEAARGLSGWLHVINSTQVAGKPRGLRPIQPTAAGADDRRRPRGAANTAKNSTSERDRTIHRISRYPLPASGPSRTMRRSQHGPAALAGHPGVHRAPADGLGRSSERGSTREVTRRPARQLRSREGGLRLRPKRRVRRTRRSPASAPCPSGDDPVLADSHRARAMRP